jgi:hypothetical protein
MRSSRTITLFTESSDIAQRPTSFVASILFHIFGLALLIFGVVYSPHLDTRAIAERYTMRSLELDTPEQMRRSAEDKVAYPGPLHGAHANSSGGKPAAMPAALRQIAKAEPGPQTLVQADLHSHIKLTQEAPVPTVLIWSPQKAPVKTIMPPLPEKPTAADVKPSLDPPNVEVNLADISISASPMPVPKLATLPSTTSPVAIHAPDRVQLPPATVSQPSAQPTPTTVMSLSDLRMAHGSITLPPINETVASNAPGALAAGQVRNSSGTGNSNQAGNGGTGQGGANSGNPSANAGTAPGKNGAGAALPHGAESGSGQGNQGPPATRITLPRDGQFGSVVVGDSLEDQFPELRGVLTGRLAYTVYLHVGLAKSWILQYSLPRSNDAAAAGVVARLEAPWPFNIVRPNLAPADEDTIMVHGFVNQAGRFEALSIVFPPQFPQAQFVLKSLEQWQFRPATQNGQIARVEVLLIIPEDLN